MGKKVVLSVLGACVILVLLTLSSAMMYSENYYPTSYSTPYSTSYANPYQQSPPPQITFQSDVSIYPIVYSPPSYQINNYPSCYYGGFCYIQPQQYSEYQITIPYLPISHERVIPYENNWRPFTYANIP